MEFPINFPVVEEEEVKLYVNQTLFHTFLCTPEALKEMAVGHVFIDGGLNRPEQIKIEHIDWKWFEIHLSCTLEKEEFPMAPGGVDLPGAAQLQSLIQIMFNQAVKYKKHRGIHCGALSDGKKILAFYEDVGRHNVLDKLIGHAFLKELPLNTLIYLTSGRINATIAEKAAAGKIPYIISRSIITSRALDIAKTNNLGIIGRVESASPIVYNVPE